MKIAVVGSRGWADEIIIEMKVRNYFQKGDTFISGGALGVDSVAEKIIDKINTIFNYYYPIEQQKNDWIKKIIFKPDWNKYGKRAGFLCNELIINEADKVIAFWDGSSKGTKHSIDLAIKASKPIDIYVRPK